MRLGHEGAKYFHLLTSVLPLFKSELPVSKANVEIKSQELGFNETQARKAEETRRNFYDDFCIEASLLNLNIDPECTLTVKDFRLCKTVLEHLLNLFESLLTERLKPAQAASEKLPKLRRLKYHIQSMLKAGDSYHHLDKSLNGAVAFSTSKRENSKTLKILKKCNELLTLVFTKLYRANDTNGEQFGSALVSENPSLWKLSAPGELAALTLAYSYLESIYKYSDCHVIQEIWNHFGQYPYLAIAALDPDSQLLSHGSCDLMLLAHRDGMIWVSIKFTHPGDSKRDPDYPSLQTLSIDLIADDRETQEKVYENCCSASDKAVNLNNLLSHELSYQHKLSPQCRNDISISTVARTTALLHSASLLPIGHFVSLRQLFHGGYKISLAERANLTLRVTKSVLGVYDSPWLESGPNKDNIFFSTQTSKDFGPDLTHIYVGAGLQKERQCSSLATADENFLSHPYIVSLGILLLELQLNSGIESYRKSTDLGEDGTETIYTDFITAWRLSEAPGFDAGFSRGSSAAIRSCLRCDFLSTDLVSSTPRFYQALFERVILPLEKESSLQLLKQDVKDDNDDDWKSITSEDEIDLQKSQSNDRLAETECSASPRFITKPIVKSQRLRLFDDEIPSRSSDKDVHKLADSWFSRLSDYLDAQIHPLLDDPDVFLADALRTTVVILDTGIDFSDPFIKGAGDRIIKSRNWIADENGVVDTLDVHDTVGHGTHCAALLLKVAPGADICVARIAQDTELEHEDYVAEAIAWAIDDCNADIITMSFGFSTRSDSTHTSITRANAAGKILFAATSNNGGNGKVAYPANKHEVIGINSTDGKGNKSHYNPSPLRQNSGNFSTLGEAVESSWPKALSSEGLTTARKSGTSFATPIAAGLAANVLDFVRLKLNLGEKYTKRLYTGDGMRAIFELMSEPRDGYNYVAPWVVLWDEDCDSDSVRSSILQALKKV